MSHAPHWGMAVAIALMCLLAVAWRLSGHTKTPIPVHKAPGTLPPMPVFARILWAIAAEQRPRAASLAARLGHLALYLLMLTVPTIALIRDAAADRDGSAENAATRFVDLWHSRATWLLLLLIAGHILMTAIHQRMAVRRNNPENTP
ncbi:cytochrome b/b6 domain-containing protein [Cardiobacterium valvarum]|nr:cytochrome b/b6 domain-containing protein [Cardiobacterium valvarum]